MLAIYSLLQVFIQIYFFLPTILTLTGTKIPLPTCFYASVLQIILGGIGSAFTLLFISLDRFIAILFPLL
jgi:hypothetical protein